MRRSAQKNQLLMKAKKSFGEKEHNKNIVRIIIELYIYHFRMLRADTMSHQDREIERELNEVAPRYKTVADIEAQQEILKSLDVIDDEAGSSKMLLKYVTRSGS